MMKIIMEIIMEMIMEIMIIINYYTFKKKNILLFLLWLNIVIF